MRIFTIIFLVILGILFLGFLGACSPPADAIQDVRVTPIVDPPLIQTGQIRQWGIEAKASSEYANPEWAALQAVGAPDTPRCGDYQTAWATAGSDTVDTIVISYTLSVHVTGINIVQSFNPDQVVKVELVSAFDRGTVVYDNQPIQIDQPCPFTLSIPVEKTQSRFNKIRITLDQSVLGLGWNQIDAVELIGESE